LDKKILQSLAILDNMLSEKLVLISYQGILEEYPWNAQNIESHQEETFNLGIFSGPHNHKSMDNNI
jgi:hypothetical protein